MSASELEGFFNPECVAVVGVSSTDEEGPGRIIFKNLLSSGFRGAVHAVNPKASEIEGSPCFAKVSSIPGKVDLAIIATPASVVPAVLKDCAEKGVKRAVVISGGFSEIGKPELEEEIRKISAGSGIRIVGPNCLGIYDPHSGLNAFFLPAYRIKAPKAGNVAFLSQSGAVAGGGLDWAASENIGISKIVSYGNKLDIDEISMLEYLENDPHTKVIMLYVEGLKDGKKFIEVARRVSRKKPIVAFKVGNSSGGARAVMSHTGSLAGDSRVYSGAFRQAGIVQAETLEELFDFAKAFSLQQPGGSRIQVITSGGGFGVMATDAIEAAGLKLAEMSEERRARLREQFPSHCVVKNPIDITGDADAARYLAAIDAAIEDENVDAVLVIFLFQLPKLSTEIVKIMAAEDRKTDKPLVAVAIGSEFTHLHKVAMESSGLPVYDTPERAVRALKALAEAGRN
ncbi:MAG: CoA-binding protein [archaeon]